MEETLRCPKCNSSQTRYRLKEGERVCYFCGHVWKVNPMEEDNGNI